jgi:hypothetical protein
MVRALVSQAERNIGHKTPVSVITMEDGESENSIRLKIQGTGEAEYLGRETVAVLGQKVPAYKFRFTDPKRPEAAQNVWASESGILLSMTLGDSTKIDLTEYQGPPLIP